MISNRARCTLLPGIAWLFVASPGAAQTIRGKVAQVDIAESIPGASVWLMETDGTIRGVTFADSAGGFELTVPAAGWYQVRAHHRGYVGTASEIHVPADVTVEVRINLRPDARPELDPVVVNARAPQTPGQREFESRLDLGRGTQVTGEELIRSAAGDLGTYFKLWARHDTAGCTRYYVDGRRANSSTRGSDILGNWVLTFPLDWIYGVEAYRTQDDAPVQYREYFPPEDKCSVVLVWTGSLDGT